MPVERLRRHLAAPLVEVARRRHPARARPRAPAAPPAAPPGSRSASARGPRRAWRRSRCRSARSPVCGCTCVSGSAANSFIVGERPSRAARRAELGEDLLVGVALPDRGLERRELGRVDPPDRVVAWPAHTSNGRACCANRKCARVGARCGGRYPQHDAARARSDRRAHGRRALAARRARRRHDPAGQAAARRSTRGPSTGWRRGCRSARSLVSATNGKTTTTAMIAEHRLRAALAYNRSGANLLSGVASTLLASPGAELGLFEVDEAALPEVARRVRPRVVALGNLFRDQLDRYGELELVAEGWRRALSTLPKTLLVVNADDPLVGELASGHDGGSVTYGIDDPRHARPSLQHAADSTYCISCGAPYDYAAAYVGHLGDYRCPSCGRGRPRSTSPHARSSSTGSTGATFTLETPGGSRRVRARAAGPLQRLQRDGGGRRRRSRSASGLDEIAAGLEAFVAAFGRFERIDVGDKRLLLLLIKNPAGANEAVRTLLDGGAPTPRGRRPERRDRRRPRRLLDLGRRLRAAARRARARGRRRRPRGRARAAVRLRRPRPRSDRGRPVARGCARPRAGADSAGRRAGRPPDLHGDARAARADRAARGLVPDFWQRSA